MILNWFGIKFITFGANGYNVKPTSVPGPFSGALTKTWPLCLIIISSTIESPIPEPGRFLVSTDLKNLSKS
jgi:hypothetical protein